MSVLMKCVPMITVQGLITRRIRYNRLHLLRCIWLFPTLGTNLSEWEHATKHPTMTRIRSDKFVRNTSELIESLKWVETTGRIAKQHSSFHSAILFTCNYARKVHRECFVSLSSFYLRHISLLIIYNAIYHFYYYHLIH